MAALQCEICGGKLMAKAGGLFECEYCGMQYDKSRIQEMVQEIKGTVKVEGTVEVTGTVKVEGTANIENFLKRAKLALEDCNWEKAVEFFDAALNLDAESAEAYLGKLLAELHIKNQQELQNCETSLRLNKNYEKALCFANAMLRSELESYQTAIEQRQKKAQYDQALAALNDAATSADYRLVETLFAKLEDFSDSAEKAAECRRKADELSVTEQAQKTADIARLSKIRAHLAPAAQLISTGTSHTVGLKSDGTAVAVGWNDDDQCDISRWSNLVAVGAGGRYSAGLKKNGTVVATGQNEAGECNVSGWTNIVAICTGIRRTIGLKQDGTVVAAGWIADEQHSIFDWTDIVSVSIGGHHIVGLKKDGTVVAAGANDTNRCSVSDWIDIVAIDAGSQHTVGLKNDGTVVATGSNSDRRCDVSDWTDIVAISAGGYHTIGLKADGTAVAVGNNDEGQCNVSSWTNIVAISAGQCYTVGLKKDGTLVAAGSGGSGQCDVSDWKLFDNYEHLEEERVAALEKREAKRALEQQQRQWRVAGLCQHCGGEFKGFFTKKCVACGKPKDY